MDEVIFSDPRATKKAEGAENPKTPAVAPSSDDADDDAEGSWLDEPREVEQSDAVFVVDPDVDLDAETLKSVLSAHGEAHGKSSQVKQRVEAEEEHDDGDDDVELDWSQIGQF